MENKEKIDMVNSPAHYKKGGIECIEALKASMTDEAFKGYLKGNAIKYLWRYESKNKPIEDLEKCRWYVNKLIDTLEKSEEELIDAIDESEEPVDIDPEEVPFIMPSQKLARKAKYSTDKQRSISF